MASTVFTLPFLPALGTNGTTQSGAKLYFYDAGTLTPRSVYTDAGLSVPHANPVVANGAGRFDTIYLDPAVSYRIILKDSAGVQIGDIDNYTADPASANLATSGSTLIKYKASSQAAVTTYSRSIAQLKAIGADEGDGLNLIHFIDPDLDDALLDGSNTTALDTYLDNAIAELAAVNAASGRRQRLAIPAVEILLDAAPDFSVDDFELYGPGASLRSTLNTTVPAFVFSGDGIDVTGVKFDMTAGGGPYVNITGPNVHMLRSKIVRADGTAGIPCYLRYGSDGFWFIHSEMSGGDGFGDFRSSNSIIAFSSLKSGSAWLGDDAIAPKAVEGPTTNIRVIGNRFEGFSDFMGIGTQIGTFNAADATYSKYVSDVVIEGNVGFKCARILYVKPGVIDAAPGTSSDYRDGTVANVICSNNVLRDPDGSKFVDAFLLKASRGSRIFNVRGKNNLIEARGATLGQSSGLTIDIAHITTGGAQEGTAASKIEGVDIGFSIRDPYQAAANAADKPGYPVTKGFNIFLEDTAYGSMADIFIDADIDGSSEGNVIGASLDDAVHIRRLRTKNANVTGTATSGVVTVSSRVTLGTDIKIDSSTAAKPWRILSPGSLQCPELSEQVYLRSSIAAATDVTFVAWMAKRRCQLLEIIGEVSADVAQEATDVTVLAFADLDGTTGSSFGNWSNNTTGATGSRKRSGLTAGAFTTLWKYADVTTDADKIEALFPRDGRLQITKTHTNAGKALSDLKVQIRAAPY